MYYLEAIEIAKSRVNSLLPHSVHREISVVNSITRQIFAMANKLAAE